MNFRRNVFVFSKIICLGGKVSLWDNSNLKLIFLCQDCGLTDEVLAGKYGIIYIYVTSPKVFKMPEHLYSRPPPIHFTSSHPALHPSVALTQLQYSFLYFLNCIRSDKLMFNQRTANKKSLMTKWVDIKTLREKSQLIA